MFTLFAKLTLAAKAWSAKRRASRADKDASVVECEVEYERGDIDIRSRETSPPNSFDSEVSPPSSPSADSCVSSPWSSPSPPPSPISHSERAFIPTPPAPVRRSRSARRLVKPRYVELDRMRARGPDGDHVEVLGKVDNKTFRANAWRTAAAYAALHDPTALLAAPASAAAATTPIATAPLAEQPSLGSANVRRQRPRPDAIYVLGELDINPRVPRGARIPASRRQVNLADFRAPCAA